MEAIQNQKKYDLEERTLEFAKNTRMFIKSLPKSIPNIEYSKQLIRSSGSIGANYIEANESLSKKDFLLHIRISRKEAKESQYWLKLCDLNNEESIVNNKNTLLQEAIELTKIFSSIVEKSKY